ncbi:hypothetical protein [Massilia sp. KIM]|uniref:hypothetical protein n=1 Tax=Massilia sp. KIM TaxID=1955422 RepID=UPI00117EABFB|nr:hypothetical protein [Massilia sp. KIM]
MRTATAVVAVLTWSLLVGIGAYALGWFVRDARQASHEVQALRTQAKTRDRKDQVALAAGVRTERAQARADEAFQTIRTDYEADLRKNPDAGCVLDADSLRRWNEANAQSHVDPESEPSGAVQTAAEARAWPERGHEPH